MNLTPECCSVHTHSVLCDGKGTLAEMAAAAYAAGVRFFGASGVWHAFWVTEFLTAGVSYALYRRGTARRPAAQ